MSGALVRLSNVAVDYRRNGQIVPALRDVSLEILRGECVGVIGTSGSGKSTLSRVLLGLEQPSRGRRILDDPTARFHAVFQDPASSLNPHLEVHRILAEPLLAQRAPRGAVIAETTARALAEVGLDSAFLTRRPSQMSGGEQQRVALARALLAEPDLLVLDEAFASLDAPVRNTLIQLVGDIRRRREVALVVISHDLRDIRRITERSLVFLDGRIVEQGPTADLARSPVHPMTQALAEAAEGARHGLPASDLVTPDDVGCPIRHWCPRANASCCVVPGLTVLHGARSVACRNP